MTNTKTITNNDTNGIFVVKDGIGSAWNNALDKSPIRKGREKVIKDYFDLYKNSGIIDFFARRVRKEFNIPKFHPNDLQTIIIPTNEGETVEEEKSQWYESLIDEKKTALNEQINRTLQQLYLPKSAFDMFLHYLLYRKKINSYPFDNTDLLYSLAYGYQVDEILGYSPNEIKGISKLAIILLQEKREMIADEEDEDLKWVDEQIKLIPYRTKYLIKELRRATRPLRDLQQDIKIIKILKKYKKPFREFDNEEYKYIIRRMTSEKAVTKINPDLNPNYLEKGKVNLRKQIERLKKKFPFLEEFISS